MNARTTGAAGRQGGGKRDDRPDAAGSTADPVTQGLRQLFGAVEDEPVPDEFLRLLDAIDQQRNQAEPPASALAAGDDKAS